MHHSRSSHLPQASLDDCTSSYRWFADAVSDRLTKYESHGRKSYAVSRLSTPINTPFSRSVKLVARERKSNIGFYQHWVEATGIDPSRTIFVDDKIENVLTAQ